MSTHRSSYDRFATNEARVANVDALEAEVEATMRERDVDEGLDVLVDEHGLAAGPVRSVRDVVEDERAHAGGQIVDLPHDSLGAYPAVDSPLQYETGENGFDRQAPVLGAATVDVLSDHGYSDEDVAALLEDGVVADPSID
jgi:crotonobetainyl-CoA:carnitine CoA-transferase CaiB-like acyl-CoA transferase